MCIKTRIFKLFGFLFILLPQITFAHEQWFLSPQQMHDLNALPKPILFTQLTATNVSILLLTSLCVYLWIKLERSGSREIFYDHQHQLAKYPSLSALILRLATVVMLFMAIFGMNPRIDIPMFTASTLIFPDLVLTQSWQWIKYIELLIAVCLLFGIYVRVMAVLLLFTGILGIYLFGYAMLFYIGFIIGISAYLFLQGAGLGKYSLPVLMPLTSLYFFLENQPATRAQFILRVLTGLDFALTGFICKFLHPNMAIGLLSMQHMPTFGLQIETIVLWMAVIETMAGILLCMGALTRPISFILFACFAFMSYAVSEPFYSHALFYGVLITCYLNGAGQWARPVAKDKPANIVILGGNLSGIHCAMQLERLLGKYTNVNVTLVHHENYFQYNPLLPDVISGYVQSANIVNLIRRVCENTVVVQGNAVAIDPIKQQVTVKLLSQESCNISYDELVIANDKLFEQSPITGIDTYTIPIMNVGDALYIKQHIIECLEQAESTLNPKQRQQLLTFTVIGASLRGTSVAAEIKSFIKSAIKSYPKIFMTEIHIILINKNHEIMPHFNTRFASAVHKKLLKIDIDVITNEDITNLNRNLLILTSGKTIESSTIISALSNYRLFLPEQMDLNEHLQMKAYNNIFLSGMSASLAKQIPFQAYYEAYLGKLAGYNVWAQSQGYTLNRVKNKNPIFCIASLGPEASTFQIGKFIISGRFAWIITRLITMFTLPGLERNLRIFVDWMFHIPFRQDIVSYLPSQMNQIRIISKTDQDQVSQNNTGHLILDSSSKGQGRHDIIP